MGESGFALTPGKVERENYLSDILDQIITVGVIGTTMEEIEVELSRIRELKNAMFAGEFYVPPDHVYRVFEAMASCYVRMNSIILGRNCREAIRVMGEKYKKFTDG